MKDKKQQKNTVQNPVQGVSVEQPAAKKARSKKPLVAVALAAILAVGAYGGAKLYDKEEKKGEPAKEKVTIEVSGTDVTINNEVQKPAEGKTWKDLLQEYFANKDMKNTDVVFLQSLGDYTVSEDIKKALGDLKISFIESGGGQ